MVASIGLAPTASADSIGNPSQQLTSFWNYYSGSNCVAMSVQTVVTNYPTETWDTAVSSAINGGSLSWSASIEGYLGLTYTPANDCQYAYGLPAPDLVVAGDEYVWTGSSWGVCEQTGGGAVNYGWIWQDSNNSGAVLWGFDVSGNGGSQGPCGAGWYYSDGVGEAYQNSAWLGGQPTLVNAGPSGPIWMS